MPDTLPVLPDHEVKARLEKELPGWKFEDGWQTMTMLFNTIAFLSEAALKVDVVVTGMDIDGLRHDRDAKAGEGRSLDNYLDDPLSHHLRPGPASTLAPLKALDSSSLEPATIIKISSASSQPPQTP